MNYRILYFCILFILVSCSTSSNNEHKNFIPVNDQFLVKNIHQILDSIGTNNVDMSPWSEDDCRFFTNFANGKSGPYKVKPEKKLIFSMPTNNIMSNNQPLALQLFFNEQVPILTATSESMENNFLHYDIKDKIDLNGKRLVCLKNKKFKFVKGITPNENYDNIQAIILFNKGALVLFIRNEKKFNPIVIKYAKSDNKVNWKVGNIQL